jgi:hypothetical protein
MVHPVVRPVAEGAALPAALTPVYPTSAQLPQAYLRKAVVSALARAPLHEVLPPLAVPPGLPSLREAVTFLHHPPPQAALDELEDRSHPAWQRLKVDELLAQQLSQLQAQRERAQLRAPPLVIPGAGQPARPAAGGAALCADRGPAARGGRDHAATWRGRSPCTGCCRATSARARRWWRRWPRRWPSRRAGNVP